jgi:hypothetical protein
MHTWFWVLPSVSRAPFLPQSYTQCYALPLTGAAQPPGPELLDVPLRNSPLGGEKYLLVETESLPQVTGPTAVS